MSNSPPIKQVAEIILAQWPGSFEPVPVQMRVVRLHWQENANCFVFEYSPLQTLDLHTPPNQHPFNAAGAYSPQMQFDASTGFLHMIAHSVDDSAGGDGQEHTYYYTLDNTLGQIDCQEIPNMADVYNAFLLVDSKPTNLWMTMDQQTLVIERPASSASQNNPAPGSPPSWKVTNLTMDTPLRPSANASYQCYYNFSYFEQSKYVHIVTLTTTSESGNPLNGQEIIINSLPKTSFDALQTDSSLSWTSYTVNGVDPAKGPKSTISTMVVQPSNTVGPFLYCFYHATIEKLQLSFSYFSIRLQAGEDLGNIDPSALQATNISSPNWTTSSVAAVPQWDSGPPLVVQAGGGIFVFIGYTLSGTGASGIVVMSQKIPESGILDPQGWFCDDTFIPLGANNGISIPGIASASVPWTTYPNTPYDDRVVLNISSNQWGGNKD